MEHKTLTQTDSIDIEGVDLKNSPVNNSQNTTNNYYGNSNNGSYAPSEYEQMRSQLDRIEQTLNFIMQHLMSKK